MMLSHADFIVKEVVVFALLIIGILRFTKKNLP